MMMTVSDLRKCRSQYKLIRTNVKKQYSDTYTCRDFFVLHVYIYLYNFTKQYLDTIFMQYKHQLLKLEIIHLITILIIIFGHKKNLNILPYLEQSSSTWGD